MAVRRVESVQQAKTVGEGSGAALIHQLMADSRAVRSCPHTAQIISCFILKVLPKFLQGSDKLRVGNLRGSAVHNVHEGGAVKG